MVLAELLVLAAAAGAVASESAPRASVEQSVARLHSSEEREAALAALEAIAAGPRDEPQSREASFALAEYWAAAAEPPPRRATLHALGAATGLYPDDPRAPRLLRALAALQVETGDPYGAHASFRRLIESGELTEADSALLAAAAANAARAHDMAAAFAWSDRVDPAELDAEHAVGYWLARLEAGQELGRYEVALAAARRLDETAPETLRVDAQAALAAARTFEGIGLLEDAIARYLTFVNLHPDAAERADALLTLGRLAARVGQPERAAPIWTWLIEEHPTAAEAEVARLELLELDGAPADRSKLPGYLEALRQCSSLARSRPVCGRLVERFIGAGLPLELVQGLAGLAAEPGQALGPLAAQRCLQEALDPALALLAARQEPVSIVLTALQAESAGVELSKPQRRIIDDARAGLGLEPHGGALLRAVHDAREARQRGDWAAIAQRLADPLRIERDASPHWLAAAYLLLAESLWRDGQTPQALQRVDEGLLAAVGSPDGRALHVLRADILFAAGRREEACADYRKAAASERTRWVEQQLVRCAEPAPAPAASGERS
jgi:tetratricopeptide (TPR) repeat protein